MSGQAFTSDDGSDPDARIPYRLSTLADRLTLGAIAGLEKIIGEKRTVALTLGATLVQAAVLGGDAEVDAVIASLLLESPAPAAKAPR